MQSLYFLAFQEEKEGKETPHCRWKGCQPGARGCLPWKWEPMASPRTFVSWIWILWRQCQVWIGSGSIIFIFIIICQVSQETSSNFVSANLFIIHKFQVKCRCRMSQVLSIISDVLIAGFNIITYLYFAFCSLTLVVRGAHCALPHTQATFKPRTIRVKNKGKNRF